MDLSESSRLSYSTNGFESTHQISRQFIVGYWVIWSIRANKEKYRFDIISGVPVSRCSKAPAYISKRTLNTDRKSFLKSYFVIVWSVVFISVSFSSRLLDHVCSSLPFFMTWAFSNGSYPVEVSLWPYKWQLPAYFGTQNNSIHRIYPSLFPSINRLALYIGYQIQLSFKSRGRRRYKKCDTLVGRTLILKKKEISQIWIEAIPLEHCPAVRMSTFWTILFYKLINISIRYYGIEMLSIWE